MRLNELFVRFGQTTCKPIGPKCGDCTLLARDADTTGEVVRPKQLRARAGRLDFDASF